MCAHVATGALVAQSFLSLFVLVLMCIRSSFQLFVSSYGASSAVSYTRTLLRASVSATRAPSALWRRGAHCVSVCVSVSLLSPQWPTLLARATRESSSRNDPFDNHCCCEEEERTEPADSLSPRALACELAARLPRNCCALLQCCVSLDRPSAGCDFFSS